MGLLGSNDEKEICLYGCRDGFIYVPSTGSKEPCPTCKPKISVATATEEELVEVKNSLTIPEDYDITEYTDETIVDTQTVRKTYTSESIALMKDVLSELLQNLYTQNIGSKISLYLYTPQVDIKRFIYSYLMRGVERGLKVAPLISVNMIYSIQKSRDHDYNDYAAVYNRKKAYNTLDYRAQQFYEGFELLQRLDTTYYDILTADILVLEATANTTNVAFGALADILAEREMRNKATIVLGYWGSSQLNSNVGVTYILQPRDWGTPRKSKLQLVELVAQAKQKAYTQNNNYKAQQSNQNQQNSGFTQPNGGYNPETTHIDNRKPFGGGTSSFKPPTTPQNGSGFEY